MQIQFIDLSDLAGLETGDVYQMVESTVYFEAYRHILEGLIEVDPENLPLQVILRNLQLIWLPSVIDMPVCFFFPQPYREICRWLISTNQFSETKAMKRKSLTDCLCNLKQLFLSLLQSLQIRLSSKNIHKLTNKLFDWLTGDVKGTLNKTEYFRG